MSKRLSNRGYRALELEYLMMDKENISSSSGAPDNVVTFKQIVLEGTRHKSVVCCRCGRRLPAAAKRGVVRLDGK